MTRISIIIPCFNTERYLAQCLGSVANQTERDIEIICVDDGSIDSTGDIIREFMARDPRIKGIFGNSTMSASLRRKQGILASSGDYLMFLDSDDWLEPTACEKALAAIEKQPVDILQFGTVVENHGNLAQRRIDMNQRMLAPKAGRQLQGNLLIHCFVHHKMSFTLWNKIYNGCKVREAAHHIEEAVFPKANDLYLAFLILFFSESYGTLQDPLYHYGFGRGMTGRDTLSIPEFKKHCEGARVYYALERFSQSPIACCRDDVPDALHAVKKQLMSEQVSKWTNDLSAENKAAGFQAIVDAWGNIAMATAAFANTYSQKDCSEPLRALRLARPDCLKYEKRPVKTIALLYRSIDQGGAQHVVANLCERFAQIESTDGEYYRVLLITDEDPKTEEYNLPDRVIRAVIPGRILLEKRRYEQRALALGKLIEDYEVDALIYSLWATESMPWDMMVAKGCPRHPMLIVHCHSNASVLYRFPYKPEESLNTFALADGVVCLSKADQWYWSLVNERTRLIENPIDPASCAASQAHSENKELLWVGRLSEEKRPEDVVRIFELVLKTIPNARLTIVGDGDEEGREKIESLIAGKNLADRVNLAGFQADVAKYYERASVLISTSMFEGFPLTLIEAASAGLPIVMYDMPYLEFRRLFEGWLSVPQGDTEAAAHAVSSILSDPKEWQDRSEELYAGFLRYMKLNITDKWINLFDEISGDRVVQARAISNAEVMQELVAHFHNLGNDKRKKEQIELKKQLDKAERKCQRLAEKKNELEAKLQTERRKTAEATAQLESLKNSRAYRLSSTLAKPVRALRESRREQGKR